jgi:hypothetical protein
MSNHFIVYHRDAAWQYTHKGSIAAPFDTRDQAIQAAIAEARETGRRDVRVIVQDADKTEETVWSATDSP